MLWKVWQLVAVAFAICALVFIEILDWHGRFDVIEKRWPTLWAAMNNRAARLLLIVIAIAFLSKDFHDAMAVGAPPVARLPPPPSSSDYFLGGQQEMRQTAAGSEQLKITALFRGYSRETNNLRRAEWLVLSNKIVTPVTLLMSCNRELASAKLSSEASRVAFTGETKISATQWELSMSAPVWGPTAPLSAVAEYSGEEEIYCTFTSR